MYNRLPNLFQKNCIQINKHEFSQNQSLITVYFLFDKKLENKFDFRIFITRENSSK